MALAAERAHRSVDAIKLLAVSKTKPVEAVKEAFVAGQLDFAENYVQEAKQKAELIPQANWHFIGTLQTNKVALLGTRFGLIHSVDRLRLVNELEKFAFASKRKQNILIQVHVGDEPTKHGVSQDELANLVAAIIAAPSLVLKGLMAMPPLTDDERVARSHFAAVRNAHETCLDQLKSEGVFERVSEFSELSMGTTHDFEWAILEGATMIRVGTAIFGAR